MVLIQFASPLIVVIAELPRQGTEPVQESLGVGSELLDGFEQVVHEANGGITSDAKPKRGRNDLKLTGPNEGATTRPFCFFPR